jgi:putative PIN family toxin of toxin-antitoxin system
MIKVVLDTNIIISAAISNKGNPSKIISLVSEGKLTMYFNAPILNEYADVLSRDKFKLNIIKQKAVIDKIKEIGILIEPNKSSISLPDESDRKFYDTAKAANAYLITGNTKHFPEEPHILTPAQFTAASSIM